MSTRSLANCTFKSLIEDPRIADIAPDAISKRDLSQEPLYHMTLKEIADNVGWGNLERGLGCLLNAADNKNYYTKLYSEAERAEDPNRESASLVYLPSKDPAADQKPFIFLVPGGGFINVWNLTEGWPIADYFNNFGYHVFILTYQVSVEASAVRAMEDAARALKMIKARKDEFHVDPDRYITCGFSAGGYVICLWNTEKGYRAYDLPKPEACFPIYPVTSYKLMATSDWHVGTSDEFALSGAGCTMEEACNSCFEIPEHVEGFPPTAIFLAAQDDLVPPAHSTVLAEALDKAGIPCRLEMGPTGGHGFADGEGMCMEGWPQRAIEWFEQLK